MAKKKESKPSARTPAAKDALARFKYELAHEIHTEAASLRSKGDSYHNKPSVGEYMVNQMIETQKEKI